MFFWTSCTYYSHKISLSDRLFVYFCFISFFKRIVVAPLRKIHVVMHIKRWYMFSGIEYRKRFDLNFLPSTNLFEYQYHLVLCVCITCSVDVASSFVSQCISPINNKRISPISFVCRPTLLRSITLFRLKLSVLDAIRIRQRNDLSAYFHNSQKQNQPKRIISIRVHLRWQKMGRWYQVACHQRSVGSIQCLHKRQKRHKRLVPKMFYVCWTKRSKRR